MSIVMYILLVMSKAITFVIIQLLDKSIQFTDRFYNTFWHHMIDWEYILQVFEWGIEKVLNLNLKSK